MIDATQADIGRKVLYRGYGGEIEEGVLVSMNSAYLFVRFGAQHTPQACSNDERIEWVFGCVPSNTPESPRVGSTRQAAQSNDRPQNPFNTNPIKEGDT